MRKTNEDIIRELKYKIKLCKIYKERIETKSEELFRQFVEEEISHSEYKNLIKKELDNKTLDQWSLVYDIKIAKFKEEIEKLEKGASGKSGSFTLISLFFMLFTVSFIGVLYFGQSISVTGLTFVENITSYSEKLNIATAENINYTWLPQNIGEINSLRISGVVIGNGSFRIYLKSSNLSYLILDNSALEERGISGITGLAIANGENGTVIAENQTNETQIPAEENKTIKIKLVYKEGSIYDADNNGVESLDSAIDYTVENTEFNWNANSSNLCTRWQIYSIENQTAATLCYGSAKCCNFVDLVPSSENWNDIFYLYYGKYGAGFNNNVSAQVLYVDYSLEPENIHSYIYFSNWSILKAGFVDEKSIKKFFSNTCVETCYLNLNESSYALAIETENSTLMIESISYTIRSLVEEANKTNASNITAGFQQPTEPAVFYATYAGNLPKTISIQGRLTDTSNNPLTGIYNFTFRIYNVSTGSSALFEENQTLALNGGVYDAILSPTNLRFDQPYYLGIKVSNDSEMTPRINLTSSPYSFSSVISTNLSCADCVDSSEIENGTILDIDISSNASINTSKIRHTGTYQFNTSLSSIIDSIPQNFYNKTEANETFVNVAGDTMTGSLNVNNKINISSSGDLNVSGQTLLAISSGNVGVGTTAPQSKLHVIGNVSASGNLTLGEKIVFALGEVVDNILDGWVRVTGNLNVTGNAVVSENINASGNITANYYFGNGSKLTNVNATLLGGKNESELNVNNSDYLDSFNSSQFLRSDTSDTMEGNLTITGYLNVLTGNIYLTSSLTINGTITPGLDNQFDIGNSTNWWRNLYLKGTAFINNLINLSGSTGNINAAGNVTANYFIGNGSQITNIQAKNVEDVWVNSSGDIMTGDLILQSSLNITRNVSLNEIRPLTQDIIITLSNKSLIIR